MMITIFNTIPFPGKMSTLFCVLSILFFSASDPVCSQVVSTQCFADRLQRCQQEGNSVMSTVPAEFPQPTLVTDFSSNPSYHQLIADLPNKCSTIRSDLDCLLTYTIACITQVNTPSPHFGHRLSTSTGPHDVYRLKQFLDKYCDYAGGWRVTSCFNKPELKNCEASLITISSGQACHNFNTFRSCAVNYIRNNCLSHETVYISSYLLDKASDQAWQCSPGEYYLSAFGANIDRISNFAPGTHFPGDGHRHTFPVAPYSGVAPGMPGYTGTYGQYPTTPLGSPLAPGVQPPYSHPYSPGTIGIGGSPTSLGLPSSQFGPSVPGVSSNAPFGDAHSQYPHSHGSMGEVIPPYVGMGGYPAGQGYGGELLKARIICNWS